MKSAGILRRAVRVGVAASMIVFASMPARAAAPLKVFATVPDLAWLASAVGGEEVEVSSMVRGGEDAHFAEAKPSFIKKLAEADLFLSVGLDLEAGYLTALVQQARNPRVLPGASGALVAADAVTPMDVPQAPVSRAMGDVHAGGNPHFLIDPLSGLAVAEQIRARLSQLRPEGAAGFQERYRALRSRIGEALVGKTLHDKYDGTRLALLFAPGKLEEFLQQQGDAGSLDGWLAALAPYRGAEVIDDHPMWSYLSRTFGIRIAGHLEPMPGVPPTTAHLQKIVALVRERDIRVLVKTPYYDVRHARVVASASGAHVAELAHQVGSMPGTEDYVAMIDHNVRALAQALAAPRSPAQ